MADYGNNYPYGYSNYKDEGDTPAFLFLAIEPILLVTFENRAFYCSHRSDSAGTREYRVGEFLKRGQFADKFIRGDA